MEIKCDKCGATLQYSPGTQNLVCEYCGHTVKLEDEPNPGADVTADEILPIKVDKDTAISMARVYMISGITTPDDLVKEAEIKEVKMFYFPVYYIGGDYVAHWTASFGYDRKEYYKAWDEVQKKYVERYRVVTDWTPHSGTVEDNFSYKCFGLDLKSLNLSDDATQAINLVLGKIKAKGTVDYDAKYMTGCVAVPYGYSSNEAWAAYGYGRLGNAIDDKVRANAQGDHQRDWSVNKKVKLHTRESVYLPIIQVEFSYKEKSYYCYVDGANQKNFAGSDLPVDEKKKNLEDTAKAAKNLSWLPLVAAGLAWACIAFATDYRVSIGAFAGALAAAFLYHFGIELFINLELQKVHKYSDKLRECLWIQQQAQDGKIDPNSEEVAQSYTLPEPVKHRISAMLIPTVLVALLVCAVPAWYSIKVVSANAGHSAETQQTTRPDAQTQQAQSNKEPDAFEVFNRLVVLQPIGQHGQAINEVLNELASLPKPPVGDPQAVAQYMPQVEKYFAAQDYTNAIPLLQKLTEISPADSHLRGNLAYANYKVQKYQDAAGHAAVALMCDPTHASAWKVLKASCNKLGYETCVQNADRIVKYLQ